MRSSVLPPWLVGALVAGAGVTFGSGARADEEPAGANASGASTSSGDTGASAAPSSSEDLGNWGVGGTESDGQFKPRGKTGKLKEAEPEETTEAPASVTPVELGGRGKVWLDTSLAPSGSMIVPIQEYDGLKFPTEIAPGVSYVMGANYRVRVDNPMLPDRWEVGGRFGLSNAYVNGPRQVQIEGASSRDPDGYRQIATGNLELSFRPFFNLSPSLVLPVGLAVVLPTAMGDSFALPNDRVDLARWVVNQASSTMRGWEDRALFAPKRFSLVPSAEVVHQRAIGSGVLTLQGRTKVELMILTGGLDPIQYASVTGKTPPSKATAGSPTNFNAEIPDVAVNWVLGGEANYAMFDGLVAPGLRAWFAYSTPLVIVSTTEALDQGVGDGGAQFVLEPAVATNVLLSSAKDLRLLGRLALTLPVGGALGSGEIPTKPVGVATLRATVGLTF
ncbi:MAG: hypothetical protein FJ095_13010 [Deltaproteobacteria bacterium]|nr:hypothetical protein [Deltaproteobacteria bacterium]